MTRDDETARAPRADTGREWELFVREEAADSLRHVGSVNAPTAAAAREHAESLFGWTAEAMWLCPADEVRRTGGRTLGGDGDEESVEDRGDAAETEVSG
ncbi:rSAM-partnered protein, Htur_1727 family [Halopelagius inordinatus]|uniref:RSAM-partnered protein, Htur_1727 family n=1 Tax=Halopelagius inordinatus TaxID=553467 RepID=A0A1I2N4U0_9EURY|nr:Htur_1727 family rSAM-partnered candidate RiPP [Halopelagius inordinatus]SFF97859.1 rSAM-partnered protein, Htur_1727 family [Halopelagius inordinatus]